MLEMVSDRIRALELLDDPQYCGQLTMGRLKDLLLRAGFDEESAQEIANQHGNNRLNAGLLM